MGISILYIKSVLNGMTVDEIELDDERFGMLYQFGEFQLLALACDSDNSEDANFCLELANKLYIEIGSVEYHVLYEFVKEHVNSKFN